MDVSTVTSILGVLIAILALSAAVFALEKGRRAEFVEFWKKWLTVLFVIVIVLNSVAGIYLFVRGPAQLVRSDILNLLLHLFNLLAIPSIWIANSVLKMLDSRDAKRAELKATVEALTARLDMSLPRPVTPDQGA